MSITALQKEQHKRLQRMIERAEGLDVSYDGKSQIGNSESGLSGYHYCLIVQLPPEEAGARRQALQVSSAARFFSATHVLAAAGNFVGNNDDAAVVVFTSEDGTFVLRWATPSFVFDEPEA